ncbi:Dehydration-responsive element-binding protein [Ancistrocladus abbreviatus]
MGAHDNGCSQTSLLVDSMRKRKSRSRKDKSEVAEILAKWKGYNAKLESSVGDGKQVRKAPAKGSKKGCMKGKGRAKNSSCNYRGVRQRTQPNRGRRLWLGTLSTAIKVALKYDEAARTMYGPFACLNLLDYKMESCKNSATTNATTASATTSCSDSIIMTSNHSEVYIPKDTWKKIENHTGKQ